MHTADKYLGCDMQDLPEEFDIWFKDLVNKTLLDKTIRQEKELP
jgi:uncharacterized protein (DUF3820 family)